MNSEHDENLANQLADLTTWRGASPELWQSALHQSQRSRWSSFFSLPNWSLPRAIAASIALVLISAIAIAVISTSNARSRSSVSMNAMTPITTEGAIIDRSSPGLLQRKTSGNLYSAMAGAEEIYRHENGVLGLTGGYGSGGSASSPQEDSASNAGGPVGTQPDPGGVQVFNDVERQVIRKATIELTANDVRGAFLKAVHLVSEAGGEYVQDSTLSGHDENAQANFTMRIAATRLSTVLNELRTLGVVQSENLAGEDVTAQAIDLEARLRNEQRIESELLQLLETRNDAPLKEVLELREQMARVRLRIESITGQREHLNRLVSLATVLVIIRATPVPATQPQEPKEQSIGAYFSDAIASDWNSGLRFLADTLSSTLRVLIGGLFWWVMLIAGLLAVRHVLQRRHAMRLAI